jgi:hypothetical protein
MLTTAIQIQKRLVVKLEQRREARNLPRPVP